MHRSFFILFTTILISFLPFQGCKKIPKYPNEPKITNVRLLAQKVFSGNSQAVIDSVTVTLTFQDGDGDLGLDLLDPIKDTFNYYADLYIQKSPNLPFEKYAVPYNGYFPLLSPADQTGPLDGELSWGSPFPSIAIPVSNATYKFVIYIMDRSRNKSNIVETTTFKLPGD